LWGVPHRLARGRGAVGWLAPCSESRGTPCHLSPVPWVPTVAHAQSALRVITRGRCRPESAHLGTPRPLASGPPIRDGCRAAAGCRGSLTPWVCPHTHPPGPPGEFRNAVRLPNSRVPEGGHSHFHPPPGWADRGRTTPAVTPASGRNSPRTGTGTDTPEPGGGVNVGTSRVGSNSRPSRPLSVAIRLTLRRADTARRGQPKRTAQDPGALLSAPGSCRTVSDA